MDKSGIRKDQPKQLEGTAASRSGVAARFFYVSAFVGLLIGILEAVLLWTTPRVIPLLVPDVGWVVWFLAPLMDMSFFALVGLALGLLARRTAQRGLLIAAEGGITVTFVYLMVKWFHIEIGLHPFYPALELMVPLVVLGAGFIVSLILHALFWHRLAPFGDRWLDKLLKPLARGMAAATVVVVLGIGVFVIWPPMSGPAKPTVVPPPSGAPNIVFITLDTLRADHLSSYGYSRPTTPNLDRFARTGVLFENAIAAASWTLASHASMFTGLLPQQHGADVAVPLAASPWTLAEILRSQGYQTAGVVANFDYMERGWGIAQGFETYDDNSSYLSHSVAETFLGKAVLQPLFQSLLRFESFDRRDAQQINRRVYRWYRHRSHRPYFLFINYFDTHDPYITKGSYNHRFGEMPFGLIRKVHFATENAASLYSYSPQERSLGRDGYDNCLAYLDNEIGKLLTFLHNSSEWSNTVVIITSDHGEGLDDHGSFGHGRSLYRDVLHVPLMIAGPGIPKDVRISHIVGTRQLFSTVLDLAGRGHTPFSQTSLARFWKAGFKPSPEDNAVVSENVPLHPGDGGPMVSLTTPEWEYIAHRDGRQELYKWRSDPQERVNLAGAPNEEATLARVRTHLIRLVTNATGPWHGPEYLQALDSITKGQVRLSLLRPQPLDPKSAAGKFRIGIAQAFFRPADSVFSRPSRSERELMQSLPYQ